MHSLTRALPVSPSLVRFFLIAAIACSLFSFAVPKAQASGLTEAQIQAVLGVLASFDVDQTTIANVNAALHGQAQEGATDTTTTNTNTTPSNPSTGTSTALICPVYQMSSCATGTHQVVGAPTYDANNCAIPNVSCVADATTTPVVTTFSASPVSGAAPLNVTFTTNTSGATVTFGDGSSEPVSPNCYGIADCSTTAYSVKHTYTAAGTYAAKLTSRCSNTTGILANSSQCAAIGSVTVTVTGGWGISTGVGAQSIDYAGMMAAVVAAPFQILTDVLSDFFVLMGVR